MHAAVAKLLAIVLFVPLLGFALTESEHATAAPAVTGYNWPVSAPHQVVRGFDPPETPYGPGHRGVDLGAASNTPVRAAAGGVVVFAGQVAGRGVISLAHRDGLRTTYEPVSSSVARGDQVRGGQAIGTLTSGHDCGKAASCLHWGAHRGARQYVDPLGLLASGHVRLLPWNKA